MRGLMFPRDGATGAPTNVEVRIRYWGFFDSSYEFTFLAEPMLRNLEGVEVPLAIETFAQRAYKIPDSPSLLVIARPTVPLDPMQIYEVLDRVGDGSCMPDGDCSDYHVISTFQTEAEADEVPPTAAVITDVGVGCDSCYSGACCGPYEQTYGFVRWNAASDDGPLGVAYDVYTGGLRVAARIHQTSFSGPIEGYRIESVDAAGNTDPGMYEPPPPPRTCEFPGPDGGDAGPAGSTDGGGGCSVAPRSAGSPAAWAWALALLAPAVRRRLALRRTV
jgi:hypothetical protein